MRFWALTSTSSPAKIVSGFIGPACWFKTARCLPVTLRDCFFEPDTIHHHEIAPIFNELIEQLPELQALLHRLAQ